jgi:hypothetical protein
MDDSATLGLPPKVYEAYRKDFQNNTITLGNVCNASCFFCSQRMNPPGVIQDYPRLLAREQIDCFLRNDLVGGRNISIGSARHLNSGEFFLHPDSVQVLRRLPAVPINAFTNGLHVTEEHVRALKELGAQLSFSINDVRVANRVALMGGTAARHQSALELLDLLEKHDVAYSLWLLPTRTRLDNGDLEYSFRQLARLGRHFCLHTPGYTRYAQRDVVRELDIPLDALIQFCLLVKDRYRVDVGLENMPSLEDAGSHRRFIADGLASSLGALRSTRASVESCLFLCSEAVADLFPAALSAAGFGRSPWRAVKSTVFGGNVSCAGLLLVEDYLIAARGFLADGGRQPDTIVLPRVSFDVNDEDLGMRPVADLQRETGSSILLA